MKTFLKNRPYAKKPRTALLGKLFVEICYVPRRSERREVWTGREENEQERWLKWKVETPWMLAEMPADLFCILCREFMYLCGGKPELWTRTGRNIRSVTRL